MADLSRYKCSSHTNGGEHACSNGAAIQRKNIEDVILATTRDQLLSPKIFKLVKKELQILLKKEQQRRANVDPRADLKAKLAECKKQISRLARVASLTDDIEDVVIKLNGAKQEQKELRPSYSPRQRPSPPCRTLCTAAWSTTGSRWRLWPLPLETKQRTRKSQLFWRTCLAKFGCAGKG